MQTNYPQQAFEINYVYELVNVGKGVIPQLTDENLLLLRKKTGLETILNNNNYLESQHDIFVKEDLLLLSYIIQEGGMFYLKGYDDPDGGNYLSLGRAPSYRYTTTFTGLNFYNDRIEIIDSLNHKGLENAGDYEANFNPRSLTTKQYVDNRTVENNSTTTLSLSQLNTAYPLANTGFKVQCLGISAGALIYEKTATGWIKYAVEIVV